MSNVNGNLSANISNTLLQWNRLHFNTHSLFPSNNSVGSVHLVYVQWNETSKTMSLRYKLYKWFILINKRCKCLYIAFHFVVIQKSNVNALTNLSIILFSFLLSAKLFYVQEFACKIKEFLAQLLIFGQSIHRHSYTIAQIWSAFAFDTWWYSCINYCSRTLFCVLKWEVRMCKGFSIFVVHVSGFWWRCYLEKECFEPRNIRQTGVLK